MSTPVADWYRPVVAIELEGLLAVDRDPPYKFATMPFPRAVGRSSADPSEGEDVADSDEPGLGNRWAWLSLEGRSWVLSLFERGIEVVWWSRWHDSADGYFGHPTGLPAIASARDGDQPGDPSAEEFASSPLHARAHGRPLLLITNVRPRMGEEEYIRTRRPRDRAITALRVITRTDGRTLDTMAEMDAWLALVRTLPGQVALRRHRKRMLARARRGTGKAGQIGDRLPPVREVDALAARYEVVDPWVDQLVDGVREALQKKGLDLDDLGTVNEIVRMFRNEIDHHARLGTGGTNKETDA